MKSYKKMLSILLVVIFCMMMLIPSNVYAYTHDSNIASCFQHLANLQQEYMSSCKTDRYGRAYWYNPNRSKQSIIDEASNVRNNIESLAEFVEDWYGIKNQYYNSNRSSTYQVTMSILQKVKKGETAYEVSRWTTEGVFDAALVAGSYAVVRGAEAIGNLIAGEGSLLQAGTKSDALNLVKNLPRNIQSNIKSFFKGASNKYTDFSVEKASNGNYITKMTKPGDVPGSKAIYTKEIAPNGTTIQVYKDTYNPYGNLVHTKQK